MGSRKTTTMPSTSVLAASVLVLVLCVHTVVVFGRPQELKFPNGKPFYENANTVDENGCTVGYCSKNCPTGAIRNDGTKVTHRGNKGPGFTGTNGNSGPLNAAGQAVDPAAVSLLKQQERYIEWAKKQALLGWFFHNLFNFSTWVILAKKQVAGRK